MIGEAAVSTCKTIFGRKLSSLDLQLGIFLRGEGDRVVCYSLFDLVKENIKSPQASN